MGIASRYNKRRFNYIIPKDVEYRNLPELLKKDGLGSVYTVKALYINTKGNYGDSPVAVLDSVIVNLPSHLLDMVKSMLEDEEVIDAVNQDKLGFTVYEYMTEHSVNPCCSITWVDLP